jgi:hypothetical protein
MGSAHGFASPKALNMSRGERILSLEEARKSGQLDRFVKEHPSEGDERLFSRLLSEMSKTIEEGEEASSPAPAECAKETQTRRDPHRDP